MFEKMAAFASLHEFVGKQSTGFTQKMGEKVQVHNKGGWGGGLRMAYFDFTWREENLSSCSFV